MSKDPKKDYSHMGSKKAEITPAFWQARYDNKDDPWDKGIPSPGLVDFLKDADYKPGNILVPGCGRGHDARALAKAGFHVTATDIAETPIHDGRMLAANEGLKNIRFEQTNYFELPAHLAGPYDW